MAEDVAFWWRSQMRFASVFILQHLGAVARHLNPADRGRGTTLARVNHRQAPRRAGGRARRAVAALARDRDVHGPEP